MTDLVILIYRLNIIYFILMKQGNDYKEKADRLKTIMVEYNNLNGGVKEMGE